MRQDLWDNGTLKTDYTPETSVSSKTFMTLFDNLFQYQPISYLGRIYGMQT